MLSQEEAGRIKEQLFSQFANLPREQAESLKARIEAMSPEELEAFLAQQGGGAGAAECLFCQIAKGKIETIKVYEDANVLAILDINPISPGHAIVMPKQHYQFLFQLSEPLLLNLMKVVNFLSEVIINAVKARGININVAMGEVAGQRVPHLAFNLIPRHEKDSISFEVERKKVDRKEIEKIGDEVRKRVFKAQAEKAPKMQETKNAKEEKEKEKSDAEKMLRFARRRMP